MVAGECNVGDKCRTHKNTGACQPQRESHLLLPAQTPHHHRPSGGKRIAVTTNPMQPSKRRTSCLGPLEIRMVPEFSFKKSCKTSVGDGASRQFPGGLHHFNRATRGRAGRRWPTQFTLCDFGQATRGFLSIESSLNRPGGPARMAISFHARWTNAAANATPFVTAPFRAM